MPNQLIYRISENCKIQISKKDLKTVNTPGIETPNFTKINLDEVNEYTYDSKLSILIKNKIKTILCLVIFIGIYFVRILHFISKIER